MMFNRLILMLALCGCAGAAAPAGVKESGEASALSETRLLLDKWIETQQIIAREQKEWQQGKATLESRLELARKEAAVLEEKSKQVELASLEAVKQRQVIEAQNVKLKQSAERLASAASRLETKIRKIFPMLPDPIQAKVKPLYDRMPADPVTTKVSAAERFQNILGILGEANKANLDIPVVFEVRKLSDGKLAEVRVLYVGLAQAYYLSAAGQAGIGRPASDGWKWEASDGIAREVRKAIEIHEGKRPPAFVYLPMELQ